MNMIFRAIAAVLPLLLAACLNQSSAPSAEPGNFTVMPGEGRVALNWTTIPGLTYWVYYKNDTDDPTGTVVSKDSYTGIAYNLSSPTFIGGLINDKEYSFLVTSSDNNSKTGPTSAVMKVTPRLVKSGTSWTASKNVTSNNLTSIAYGNNYYAIVGNSSTVLTATHNYPVPGGVTTTDSTGTIHYGNNNSGWIPSTGVGSSTNYSAVLYNGSGFVAMGEDGSTIYSTATTTWTLGTPVPWTSGTSIGATGTTMNALALGGIYVAVGNGGKIFTTPSITGTWTAVANSPTTQNLYGVSYVNGIYIAVGAGGTLLTSPDSVTWTLRTTNTNNYDLHQVAYGASTYVTDGVSKYVAVGDAGTIISSTDAITWSQRQSTGTTQNLRTICFGPAAQFIAASTPVPNSQFIVAGTAGTILLSTSGADTNPSSWTASTTVPSLVGSIDLNSIVPTDVLIAVGTAGNIVSVQ